MKISNSDQIVVLERFEHPLPDFTIHYLKEMIYILI